NKRYEFASFAALRKPLRMSSTPHIVDNRLVCRCQSLMLLATCLQGCIAPSLRRFCGVSVPNPVRGELARNAWPIFLISRGALGMYGALSFLVVMSQPRRSPMTWM